MTELKIDLMKLSTKVGKRTPLSYLIETFSKYPAIPEDLVNIKDGIYFNHDPKLPKNSDKVLLLAFGRLRTFIGYGSGGTLRASNERSYGFILNYHLANSQKHQEVSLELANSIIQFVESKPPAGPSDHHFGFRRMLYLSIKEVQDYLFSIWSIDDIPTQQTGLYVSYKKLLTSPPRYILYHQGMLYDAYLDFIDKPDKTRLSFGRKFQLSPTTGAEDYEQQQLRTLS